jgi:hypothetical protein
MSQRPSGYRRQPNEDYQTPSWVTRVVVPYLKAAGVQKILEPAAGKGLMVQALRTAGFKVTASDILTGKDFLKLKQTNADAIVTNPPYGPKGETEKFIRHALALVRPQRGMVAMLQHCDYDHAKGRADLFDDYPFLFPIRLRDRIVFFKKKGADPSYYHAWFVWSWKHQGPEMARYGYNDELPARRGSPGNHRRKTT